jgi:hypothetical protein
MTPKAEDHTLALVLSDRMPELDRESLSPAGWDRIVGRAQVEAVAPLLYWTLSRSPGIDILP